MLGGGMLCGGMLGGGMLGGGMLGTTSDAEAGRSPCTPRCR
jgi:hypothetical protein